MPEAEDFQPSGTHSLKNRFFLLDAITDPSDIVSMLQSSF